MFPSLDLQFCSEQLEILESALHPDTLLVVQRHYLAMVASAESVISSPVVLYSNSVLPVSPSPLTSLAVVSRPSQALLSSAQQSVETKILSYSTSSTLLRQRQSSSGASMTNLVVLSPSLVNSPIQTLIIPLIMVSRRTSVSEQLVFRFLVLHLLWRHSLHRLQKIPSSSPSVLLQ